MKSVVLFPLLLAAASTPQAAGQTYQDPPIQVWLDQDGEYDRGDEARVWVHAARDGFLLILHADAERRIRVLFPLDPGDDDFIRGGVSLEVRGRGDTRAFYVDESHGDGLVLAAWSPDPFRIDAYVRGDHWDFRALAADGARSDLEAGLLDIVYRMADGRTFEYAIAPYIVGRTRHRGGYSNVYYSNVTYSTRDRWCYGCFDDWRFGFSFGLGWRSGFNLSMHFGSPYYVYRPWYYDPFYAFGHPIWYRPAFYGPYRYAYDPYWYNPGHLWGVWGWDPYFRYRDPWGWWYGPRHHYRYAGVGIHLGYGNDCYGDPFCRDPYRGRTGYATGIALGSGFGDTRTEPRRDGYVTPRGYAQGRADDRGGSNTQVIGLGEGMSRSEIARRATTTAIATEPGGRTLSTRSLREAVQSEPPQRSSNTTNRLREAVQSEPPQRSSSTTNRLREAVQSEPPQRSSSTYSRLRDAMLSSPPQRSSTATSRLREAVQSEPPQRSSSATSRLREAVQSAPPDRSSPARSTRSRVIVPDRSSPPSSSRANVRSAPDRSDQGISRAPTRVVPDRSSVTRVSPPASNGSSGSARIRSSVPTTRSGPPASSSRSGTARASGGASSSSRGAATARGRRGGTG